MKKKLRILHINNTAGIAGVLVKGLQELGDNAELFEIAPLFPKAPFFIKLLLSPIKICQFLVINRKILKNNYDIIHIHYAYFGWLGILGRYKYYLHCHSTDVRYTLTHPIKRLFITAALRNAEKVFYTTPDLGAPVKTIRPDAIFLPNPISTIEFNCTIPVSQNRVLLFASLNDHLKGTEKAVAAVEKIRTLPDFKDFSVTVLPHGRDYLKYKECQSLSFTTLKSRQEIVEFICSFDIIMGQFSFGSMGVSELECMSCGKPVLNYFIYEDFYPERPPLVYCKTIEDIFQNLLSLVQNKSKQQEIGKQAREWICKYHDHLKITTRLKEEYGHFPVNS